MSQRALLENIIFSTKSFIAVLPPSPAHNSRPLQVTAPALCLSKLTSHFHSELLSSGLLPQIRDLALSKAKELAAVHQQSYERVCNRLVTHPRNTAYAALSVPQVLHNLRLTHEGLYGRDLSQIIEDAMRAQASYHKKQNQSLPKSLRCRGQVFNHEYTPLLEKYFESNAYPSAPDRLILAQKTRMTPRQIEVWFQNHRNRGKKEGRTLARWKSNSLALDISIDSLESQIPSWAIFDNKKIGVNDNDSSDDESLPEEDNITLVRSFSNDVLSTSAPPHAYPTKYPPDCIKDPFPNENGTFKFSPPTWRRRPVTPTKRYLVQVNMDDFVVMFSKLNLGEGLSKKQNSRRSLGCGKRQPWFTATVTPLCSSPHPALIRVPSPVSCSPKFTSASVATRQCLSQRLHTPLTKSSRILLEDAAKRQRIFPLPRRLPRNSFTPPQALKLRTSSWSSASSSQSRSTSFSSASSTDPPTPPLSPTHESQDLGFTPENLALISEIFSSVYNPTTKESNLQSFSFQSKETFTDPFALNFPSQATPHLAVHS